MRYTLSVESAKASETFTRAEIRRILGINENSLRSWERAGLAERRKNNYSFSDLISLRTLESLRGSRFSAKRISEAVRQIRSRLANVSSPLDELKIVSEGRRIAVHLPGEKLEALTGQMFFDFDAETLRPVSTMEHPDSEEDSGAVFSEESWFAHALELEQTEAPPEEILDVYRKIVDCNPQASGAWLNMGTLYFRQRQLQLAEHCYEQAIRTFPEYSLAHYNLGNLCEETDRLEDATEHYETALRYRDDYADAHFNLAVVHERRGNLFEAVMHWQHYIELDPTSEWATVARRKRERLLELAASEEPPVGELFRQPLLDAAD